MNIRPILLVSFAVLFVFSSCKNTTKNPPQDQKTIGSLSLDKAQPKPGDNLKLQYVPENSDSETADFSAYYYTIVDQKVYAHDIKMKQADSLWKAQISIPDSAKALAFSFKTKEDYDTNDGKGFVQPLYTDKGVVTPGGLASVASFHVTMDNRLDYETEKDSILNWYQKDFKNHPEIENSWSSDYARFLLKNNRTKGETYIDSLLAEYNKKEHPLEEDYEDAFSLYTLIDQKEKRDSIARKAAEDYPKGKMAGYGYFQKFKKAEGKEEQEKIFNTYKKKIDKGAEYKDMMLIQLANSYLKEGEVEKFKNNVLQLSNKRQAAAYLNYGVSHVLDSEEDLEEAEKMIKKALAYVDPDTASNKPSFMTKSEYEKQLTRDSQAYRDTYARVLFKQGNQEAALAQQKKAVQEGENDQINENYIEYLMANDKYEEAEKVAKRFIREATATGKVKTYFEKAYAENTGSEKALEETLAQLEEKGRQKVREDLKQKMLNKAAPDLELTNREGEVVDLEDLKGKTVILDFWATWCGPCVASFPGMEKAVNEYKDHPEVKFYFVNTFQREGQEERHEKVEDFMKKHDYPFEVLYDKNEHNDFKTASAFDITGIPTKIILDPQGKWQFTKVGYGGNNDKLMEEIKMMIELVKS